MGPEEPLGSSLGGWGGQRWDEAGMVPVGQAGKGSRERPGLAGMLLLHRRGSSCPAPAPGPGQNPCAAPHTLCKNLLQRSFQTEGIFPQDLVDAV